MKRIINMKRIIFSLVTVVMLVMMMLPATPVSANNVQYELEGYTLKPHEKWTTGNLKGWAEGECIRFRYTVENNGDDPVSLNLTLRFDYKKDGTIGIVHFEFSDIPAGNVTGPALDGIGVYYWDVTIPPYTTYVLEWCARLSNEAGLWSGSNLQVRADGGKTVSINVMDIEMPDLYAEKIADVTCDAISYIISYGNSGEADQTNTVLVDDYDENKVTVTDYGDGINDSSSGTITWNIGDLAVGATGSKSYTAIIKGGVLDGEQIINTGNITGELEERATTDDNSYDVTSDAWVSPTADANSNSPVYKGATIELYGLPAGMASYYWTGPNSFNSTSQNPTIPNATTAMAGTYTLIVTNSNGCTGSDSVEVTVGAPDFSVDTYNYKEVDETTAEPGDTLTFTIHYKNTGNMDATGVVITDVVDTNLENVIPADGGIYDAGTRTITWTIGNVAVDSGGSVHFSADIVSPLDDGTIIENTGTIDSDQTEPEDTNTTQTEVESAPDFSVDTYNYKEVDETTAEPGDTLTFTIHYKNTGNMDATGVVITDVVDGNLENVIPADGGIYDAGTRTITWNIGDVAVDSGGSVSFTADIVSPLDDGTIIYNMGTIDSDQTEPEDTNTTQTEVESAPDFSVDEYNYKEVDETTAEPGDTLTFTIHYKNTGNTDATGVVITDVVDANLENVTPQDGGSYNVTIRTITWNIGPVAVNSSGTVHFTADIVSPLDDGTIIYNTGTIDSDQTEPEDTNTTETEVESAPPPSPARRGGGGCPTTKYLTVDWEETITSEPLYANDQLAVKLLGPSPDGIHSLFLEQGTHAPIVDETTYYLIVVRELEEPEIPALPEDYVALVAFNITPTDAVFDRDIFLTLGLDELQLPENILEGTITMAYYDDISGTWVELEYEAGGPPNSVAELSLSAALNHFSIFGVLAELEPTPTPPPAHFVAGGLSIEPSVEKIWETVTFVTKTGESVAITANVANDGGQEGPYTVVLKLNGETVDTKTVTLGAGQSQPVSFTVSGLDYGQYEVEVAGLSDEFTTSRAITWWLIIVLIVALGLVIWGVVWGRRRRRKAHQEA